MSVFWKKLAVRTGVARFLPVAKRLTGGDTETLHYFSDRVLAAPVADLLDPATFPEVAGPDVMDLNQSAPRFDSAISGGRTAERTGHPPAWGLPQLRQAVADQYRRRDGRGVHTADDVLVTHGATAAFAATLDAFVNPGDRVVLFDPCSPVFSLGAKSRRAKVRWVPTGSEDGRTRFDEATLAGAMRGAKLLAVADPGNPTGGVLSPEDLARIAFLADKHDVLVYLDESFARFRYDGQPCGLAALPGMERRTLSAGSFTPGYGLGSLRVGWLTGPRSLVRAVALTANLSAPYVPGICQQIAARAMQADESAFAPVLDEFRDRRRYAFDSLRKMGLDPTWPTGGFFFWLPVTKFGLDGRAFAEKLMKDQRVLVGPGCAYGPNGTGFVRVSFATEDGRMREGLARLAAFVAGGSGEPVVRTATISVPVSGGGGGPETVATQERIPVFSRV
jgi:aspartate/methionine/tyrosine aminotransferase